MINFNVPEWLRSEGFSVPPWAILERVRQIRYSCPNYWLQFSKPIVFGIRRILYFSRNWWSLSTISRKHSIFSCIFVFEGLQNKSQNRCANIFGSFLNLCVAHTLFPRKTSTSFRYFLHIRRYELSVIFGIAIIWQMKKFYD